MDPNEDRNIPFNITNEERSKYLPTENYNDEERLAARMARARAQQRLNEEDEKKLSNPEVASNLKQIYQKFQDHIRESTDLNIKCDDLISTLKLNVEDDDKCLEIAGQLDAVNCLLIHNNRSIIGVCRELSNTIGKIQ